MTSDGYIGVKLLRGLQMFVCVPVSQPILTVLDKSSSYGINIIWYSLYFNCGLWEKELKYFLENL